MSSSPPVWISISSCEINPPQPYNPTVQSDKRAFLNNISVRA